MATHQQLAGFSDDEMVQRMVETYAERFDDAFWTFFDEQIGCQLATDPVVADIGCGPGLFLREIGVRYPQATLYGYDVTPAMIRAAQQLEPTGAASTFALHDVASEPLPLAAGSVQLVSMAAVLHLLPEPFPVCAEIQRIMAPDGVFLLHDWIRTSLRTYVESRTSGAGAELEESRRRALRLFPVHNKYTSEDWTWLLSEAGFTIRTTTQFRPHFQTFVCTV